MLFTPQHRHDPLIQLLEERNLLVVSLLVCTCIVNLVELRVGSRSRRKTPSLCFLSSLATQVVAGHSSAIVSEAEKRVDTK